ncbi:hypothetical protein CJP72_04355 [Citrobacter sp. NCU1]|nr:hypothetical protein [Citrobacter sp. NCU1]
METLLRGSFESGYYVRKCRQTVCHLGRNLYMPLASFYIQKSNEEFVTILIFIANVCATVNGRQKWAKQSLRFTAAQAPFPARN